MDSISTGKVNGLIVEIGEYSSKSTPIIDIYPLNIHNSSSDIIPEPGSYKIVVKNKNNLNLMNQQRFRVHSLIDDNFGSSELFPKDTWFMTFQVEKGKFPKNLKVDLKGHFYFGLNIDYEIYLYHDFETIFNKNSISKNSSSFQQKLEIGIYKFYIKNTSLKEGQEFKFSLKSLAFGTDDIILSYKQEPFLSPQFIVFSDYDNMDFEIKIQEMDDPLAQYNIKILKELNSISYINSIEEKRKFQIDFKQLIAEKNVDGIQEIIYQENFKEERENLIPVTVLNDAHELIEKTNFARTKIERSLVKQNMIEINKSLLLVRDLEPKYCELLDNSIKKAEICLVSLQKKEKYLDDMREIVESPFDLDNFEKLKNLRKEAYEQIGMYMFPKNFQERNILKYTEELLIKFEKKKEENKILLCTLESLIELDDLKTLESFLKSNKNDLPKNKFDEAMSIINLNEEMNRKIEYEKYMKEKSEMLIEKQLQEEKEQAEKSEKEKLEKEKKVKEIERMNEIKKMKELNESKIFVEEKVEEKHQDMNEYHLKKKTVLDDLHQDLMDLESVVKDEFDLQTPLSTSPGGKFDLFVNPTGESKRKSSRTIHPKKELEEKEEIEEEDIYENKQREAPKKDVVDSANEVHQYKIKVKEVEVIPNICKDFHQAVLQILRYMELEKDPDNVVIQNIDPYSEFIDTIFECLKTLLVDSRKVGIFKTKTSVFDIAKKYDSKVVSEFRLEKIFQSGKEQRSLNEGNELFIRYLMHSGRACNIFRSIIQDFKYSKSVYEESSFIRNEEYRDQLLLTFDLMEHIRFSFLLFGASKDHLMTPRTPATFASSPLDVSESNNTLSSLSTPLENSKSEQKLDEMILEDVDPIIIKKKKKKKKTIHELK
eukprot:gene9275-1362_t